MTELHLFPEHTIQRVAIVDGKDFEKQIPYWYPEIAGFKTVHVPRMLRGMEEIVSFIRSNADAVVCVHRLGRPDFRAFYGAELVAALYDAKIPALLVTQYLDIDQHSSLRKWRDKVPVVLHLREFDPASIKECLEFCQAEIRGNIPETRVPYRVMVYINNVESVLGEQYVDGTIDCWDHYQVVRFPLLLIPQHLHDQVIPGAWFFAHVNVKTDVSHELYFREFVLAPEPEYEENLTYCVNMLDGTGDAGFGEEDAQKRFAQ